MESNTLFSTKLTMNTKLGFQVVKRDTGASQSTEIQPDLTIQFTTSDVQLNAGYRQIDSDTTSISGGTTSEQTQKTSEAVADATVRAGKLPNFRVRYLLRNENSDTDGSPISESESSEFRIGMDYKRGIFAMNGDYFLNSETNKITGEERQTSQVTGQFLAIKKFSKRVTTTLREDYLLSEATRTGAPKTTRLISTSVASLRLTPIPRSAIVTNYVYRNNINRSQGPVVTVTTEVGERTWVSNASYSFAKFLRVYGVYSTRVAKSETVNNTSPPWFTPLRTGRATTDVLLYGLNFKHRIGKINFVARYERRDSDAVNKTNSLGVTTLTETGTLKDNLDWLIDASLTSYLKLSLSEAYVKTVEKAGGSTEDTRYRLKADIGPVRGLVLNPYMDYITTVQNTPSGGSSQSTTTELVVPISYRLDVSDRVKFSLTDNYRSRTAENDAGTTKSTSNNLQLRISVPKMTKSLSASGDASFNSSTTDTTSTSSSTYTLRFTWNMRPHRLNTNFSYQTSDTGQSSTSMGLQYGLNVRMKKMTLGFQASYLRRTTTSASNATSTSESINLALTLRN